MGRRHIRSEDDVLGTAPKSRAAKVAAKGTRLRVERQTLLYSRGTGAIVFTIRMLPNAAHGIWA
jgi:hypothetical protein